MATESWNVTARGAYGMFRQNTCRRMSDVRDGTSNTVALAEMVNIQGNDFRGVMHYPEGPLYHHNSGPNSAAPDQFRTGLCVSTLQAPCIGTYAVWNTRSVILSARSSHTGGVHVAMVDGSVRFVNNTIFLTTWQNLGIPDDGKVLGEF